MKIRCDVCDKSEASVFCSADEAALCHGCDLHVHRANKLAGKHPRFSLLQPIKSDSPLCDICQERRALVFCQQDRAILCRECDISIHEANEHTQKHNRFLLTGVKLSSSSSNVCFESAIDVQIGSSNNCSTTSKRPKMEEISNSNLAEKVGPLKSYKVHEEGQGSDGGSVSTSSISEYLEMVPGWCVEDFLDPSVAASANRFCKFDCNILPLGNQDLDSQYEFLDITGFGIILQFLGKISQTSSWDHGVRIFMEVHGENLKVSDQISFVSQTVSSKKSEKKKKKN